MIIQTKCMIIDHWLNWIHLNGRCVAAYSCQMWCFTPEFSLSWDFMSWGFDAYSPGGNYFMAQCSFQTVSHVYSDRWLSAQQTESQRDWSREEPQLELVNSLRWENLRKFFCHTMVTVGTPPSTGFHCFFHSLWGILLTAVGVELCRICNYENWRSPDVLQMPSYTKAHWTSSSDATATSAASQTTDAACSRLSRWKITDDFTLKNKQTKSQFCIKHVQVKLCLKNVLLHSHPTH